MITSNASLKIKRFNTSGYHYNFVAERIYNYRKHCPDVFGIDYLPYIVAGLITFDMDRMMGKRREQKYDPSKAGFAKKLFDKLKKLKGIIGHIKGESILSIDIDKEKSNIECAYEILAMKGSDGLHDNDEKTFPVGATKILHFLNPELFIIIDSNAARAFKMCHQVPFKNTTQPGYSAKRYTACMEHAKKDMQDFGVSRFLSLESGCPITRIYDKLTFATGAG